MVEAVTSGDIGPYTQTIAQKGWNWNYDGSGGPSQASVAISNGVTCNGCFAYASVGLYVSIDVENYGRDALSIAVWVEGDAGFAAGSAQSSSASSTSDDVVIATVHVPSFDIQVALHQGIERWWLARQYLATLSA